MSEFTPPPKVCSCYYQRLHHLTSKLYCVCYLCYLCTCNVTGRFNDYNGARPSETMSQNASSTSQTSENPSELYARSPETGPPKVGY